MQKRKLRIRLQKSTKSRLKRLKLIERETYEEVLSRVVDWEERSSKRLGKQAKKTGQSRSVACKGGE